MEARRDGEVRGTTTTISNGEVVRKRENDDGVRDCQRSSITAEEKWIDEDVDLLVRVFFGGVSDERAWR